MNIHQSAKYRALALLQVTCLPGQVSRLNKTNKTLHGEAIE